jgi:hypothetical protein
VDDQRKKTIDLIVDVLLFFRDHFVSCCLSFVLAYIFLEIYVRHSFKCLYIIIITTTTTDPMDSLAGEYNWAEQS